jgi:hypothetical protein
MKNKGNFPGPFPWSVVWLTLAGSLFLAACAILVKKPDLALGALVGGPFSILNYLGLRALSVRLLKAGAPGAFPTWGLLRYGIAAVLVLFLVRVSVLCLLGALAIHLWSLGVLVWTGIKESATPKTSR